jgi:hypothetical protein
LPVKVALVGVPPGRFPTIAKMPSFWNNCMPAAAVSPNSVQLMTLLLLAAVREAVLLT